MLNALAPNLPGLIGGSADLAPSNMTLMKVRGGAGQAVHLLDTLRVVWCSGCLMQRLHIEPETMQQRGSSPALARERCRLRRQLRAAVSPAAPCASRSSSRPCADVR